MIKKVAIFCIILTTSLYCNAHTSTHQYIPFVQEGKAWVDYDYQENYIQVGISGTTTIDGKEYYNLYSEEFNLITVDQTGVSDSKLHGYIREENKRVYVRELNNEQEFLIYDFGAQVGDTIDWATLTYDWTEDYKKRYIVIDSIKPHTYYGKERNVYYVTLFEKMFEYIDGEYKETENGMSDRDVWIEGVGTLGHPIMSILDDRYRFGATGMTWFKYFYDYNTQEIFPETTPFGAFSYPGLEPREYLPQPTTDYEYIFINDKNEIIRKKWNIYFHDYFLRSELIEDKVVGDLVARFEGCEIEKELFEYTRYDEAVIFDYSKQVGDTLNVPIDSSFSLSQVVQTDNIALYDIWYKHIEVLSIETVVYNGVERLCYNLKSSYYKTTIEYGYTTPETEEPQEEDYYERFIEAVELDSFEEQWIEGVGYTTYLSWANLDNKYILQCVFEKGENIYSAENIDCNGLGDNPNHKIDFTTLTLHHNGDVLVAVFPTAGMGEAITLYDATGRVVATQPIREGATTASIYIANLPNGIYIARLNSSASEKIAL